MKKQRRITASYELVTGLAYSLNALMLDEVSVQDVLRTLEECGIKHHRKDVFRWFGQWEKTADAGASKYVLGRFHEYRFRNQDSPAKTENEFEKFAYRKCLLPSDAIDEVPFEEYEVSDQRTELRVLFWYMRVRPLISQLVFRMGLHKSSGRPSSVLEYSQVCRLKKNPASMSNALMKSLEDQSKDFQ